MKILNNEISSIFNNCKNNQLNKKSSLFSNSLKKNTNKKNIDSIVQSVETMFINMVLSNKNVFYSDNSFFNSDQIKMLNSMYSYQLSTILSKKGLGLNKFLNENPNFIQSDTNKFL